MTVTESVMQVGEWNLELHPDTPMEVRNKIKGFATLVVMPGRLDVADMADSRLTDALYCGVITKPGPQFAIGGHGLAFWLGTGERYYTVNVTGNALPELLVGGVPNLTLTQHLTAAFVGGETGLTLGTVTDPSSGTQKITENIQWTSTREVLDSKARDYAVEWKVNTEGTVDVGPYTTLYGTPTVIVSPSTGGRDIGYRGIEGLIDRTTDLFEYANRLYIMGRDGYAKAGSPASTEPYRGFNGHALWISATVDSPDVSPLIQGFTATRMLSQFSVPQLSVKVTSGDYDLTGDVQAGSRVYVWDPDHGIAGSSSPEIEWRGETIYPLTFRIAAKRWPISEGLGVYCRRHTGNYSAGIAGTLEYIDLSDYVMWETGESEYEIAYDTYLNWRK